MAQKHRGLRGQRRQFEDKHLSHSKASNITDVGFTAIKLKQANGLPWLVRMKTRRVEAEVAVSIATSVTVGDFLTNVDLIPGSVLRKLFQDDAGCGT